MKLARIAYAGSFDPPTLGHVWVAKEALELADEALILIASNAAKKHMFSDNERVAMMRAALSEQGVTEKCRVELADGRYIAQIALSKGCQWLIRGARNSADFDYEAQLQRANSELLGGIKTLFIMPPRELEAVSSSFVKTLVGPPGWHWVLSPLLPKSSMEALLFRRLREHAQRAELGKRGPSLDWVLDASRWGDPRRRYHTPSHLCHTLDEIKAIDGEDTLLAQAAFAHDLIYTAQKGDEAKSAKAWLKSGGRDVTELVMSTTHQAPAANLREALLCSADLAILSARPDIYDQYSANVRAEYLALTPSLTDEAFSAGRARFLAFLIERARAQLLFTHPAYAERNAIAALNAQRELASLQAAAPAPLAPAAPSRPAGRNAKKTPSPKSAKSAPSARKKPSAR